MILKEEGAEKMLALFDGESDTPELIWDSPMRVELRRVIGQILDQCVEERRKSGSGNDEFVLDPKVRVKYQKLDDELFVGGVYVSRFLKEPTYNIRDPTRFLEMLMQRWSHELQMCTQNTQSPVDTDSTALTAGANDSLQSVTNASVYVCKVRSNLCEKLSSWGYMNRCMSLLEDVLAKELYGTPLLSIMRILHVSVNCRQNVESLIMSGKNNSSHGIVPMTMRSIESNGLHKDVAFMLEMLKRLFANALGEIGNAEPVKVASQHQAFAMAPSPAPGEGPVSRNRVMRGNPLDDPLAMPAPSPAVNAGGQTIFTEPAAAHDGQQRTISGRAAAYSSQTNIGPHPMTNINSYGQPPQRQQNSQPSQSFTARSSGMYGSNQQHSGFAGYQCDRPIQGAYHQQPYIGQFQGAYTPASYDQRQPMPRTMVQETQNYRNSRGIQRLPESRGVGNTYPGMTGELHAQSPTYSQPGNGVAQQHFHFGNPHPSIASSPATSGQQLQQFRQPQLHRSQQQEQPQYQQAWSRQAPATMQQFALNQNHSPNPQQNQQQMHQPRQIHQTQTPASIEQNIRQDQSNSTSTSAVSMHRAHHNYYGQHPPSTLDDRGISHVFSSQQRSSAGGETQEVQGYAGMQQHDLSSNTIGVLGQQSSQQTTAQADPVLNPPQVPGGTGIDARASLSPKEEAERKIKTSSPAPGAADGRASLLECAILCNFPCFIIDNVLESSELRNVKDPAASKVHGVELLKLLTQDPGYGMKFQLMLDENPKWKSYKAQDHSLFITGPEQRADYFLTDGHDGEGQKLLNQG